MDSGAAVCRPAIARATESFGRITGQLGPDADSASSGQVAPFGLAHANPLNSEGVNALQGRDRREHWVSSEK